jgi:hypothetical protein
MSKVVEHDIGIWCNNEECPKYNRVKRIRYLNVDGSIAEYCPVCGDWQGNKSAIGQAKASIGSP